MKVVCFLHRIWGLLAIKRSWVLLPVGSITHWHPGSTHLSITWGKPIDKLRACMPGCKVSELISLMTKWGHVHLYTCRWYVKMTWLGGVTVWVSDLWSRCRGFNSPSGRYQVVTTWTGDCLRSVNRLYITNTKVNSAFHPSGVGKLSSGLSDWD